MCCSTDQAKILKIQKNKKLIFTVGYNKRFDTGVIKFKKKLLELKKNTELGKIIFIRVHRFSGTGYMGTQKNIKFRRFSKKMNGLMHHHGLDL